VLVDNIKCSQSAIVFAHKVRIHKKTRWTNLDYLPNFVFFFFIKTRNTVYMIQVRLELPRRKHRRKHLFIITCILTLAEVKKNYYKVYISKHTLFISWTGIYNTHRSTRLWTKLKSNYILSSVYNCCSNTQINLLSYE